MKCVSRSSRLIVLCLCMLCLWTLGSNVPTAAESNDLALGQPVTASHFADASPPEHAVDGNPRTHWRVGRPEGDVWLKIDLGQTTTFNRYRLTTYGYPYMSGYQIQYSDDAIHWAHAIEKIGDVSLDEAGSFPPVTARYVRFVALRNETPSSAVGLRAIELYYDANPTLNQLEIPEIGYTLPAPSMDVYDVILPAGISDVTISATPLTGDQRVTIDGILGNQRSFTLGTRDERTIPITVTDANGKANTLTVNLKRLPTHNRHYTLTYEDHFTGTGLNEDDWRYRTGSKWESFNMEKNVRVGVDDQGNSVLYIDFKQEDLNMDGQLEYSGGGVVSRPAFGYGYYEVRAKLYGDTPGLHQSFWTMGAPAPDDVYSGRAPRKNTFLEIDAFEVKSSNPDQLNITVHRHFPEVYTYPGRTNVSLDTTDWFVWGFEWLPGRVNFYVNEEHVHTYYTDDMYAPQNVLLTALADGRTYTEPPAEGASAKFDYFRYYARVDSAMNYLGNPSFEMNDGINAIAWINSASHGSASRYVKNAQSGEYALEHSHNGPYRAKTEQRLEYIPNGVYRLSAWVASSGGQTEAKLTVANHGGNPVEVDIPPAETWQKIVIEDVVVATNHADISVVSANAQDSEVWLRIDNLAFELQ